MLILNTYLILVEMPEHHAELLQRVLADSRLVSGLNLLLQIVLDSHAQLVELIPLLGQPHRRVLRVPVVQDELLFQDCSEVFDLLQVRATAGDLSEGNCVKTLNMLVPSWSYLVGLDADSRELFLEGSGTLHHLGAALGEPGVEGVGVLGELLAEFVVLLLPVHKKWLLSRGIF